ncbi:MAG: ABC transporter ATP-binding protein [Limnochordaceae bacterium]|nr:ABC transporter ATP-binding protein [Limnochordaceae bacterium]
MPLLEIEHLGIRFGGLQALHDFSLQLEEGELVGLIGPNGAGKTTVFNLVSGVYRPSAGEIRWMGRSLVGLRPSQIAQAGVARTFQNIRLFKGLSVLDNVRAALYKSGRTHLFGALAGAGALAAEEEAIFERSMEMLELFGLAHLAAEPAGSLPYGHQRRLEMARALAARPRLLLLDEPAAGMNPAEAERLLEQIRWIHRHFGVAILLIEHQMRVVMGVCPRIVVLDFGEIIAEGPPEFIRQHPRVLEAYLGRQAEGS